MQLKNFAGLVMLQLQVLLQDPWPHQHHVVMQSFSASLIYLVEQGLNPTRELLVTSTACTPVVPLQLTYHAGLCCTSEMRVLVACMTPAPSFLINEYSHPSAEFGVVAKENKISACFVIGSFESDLETFRTKSQWVEFKGFCNKYLCFNHCQVSGVKVSECLF